MVNNYKETVEKFEAEGYTLNRVKNFWLDPESAYKGVNTVFQAPSGEKFELQFHTPKSFDLKQRQLHKLYEESRLSSTSAQRKLELEKQMLELASGLQAPYGIEKIK